MKHTPGPWTLEYDYSLVMPYKRGNHIVTAGPIGPDGADREELRANARLIAAAPEMKELLQLFSKRGRNILQRDAEGLLEDPIKEFENFIGAVIEEAEQAITKATPTMNNIILTTPQIQAIIFLLDEAPEPLLDFYFKNEDKVFKENRKRWYLPITYKCKKWMQTNLGGYAKNLAEMVKESIDSDDEYWRDIEKVKRILNKL